METASYGRSVRGWNETTPLLLLSIVAFLLSLSGCGGTKILKEPIPLEHDGSLVASTNQRVSASVDWIVVRDGPGTWAKNADWDEYLLRIRNDSTDPIEVLSIAVYDSSGMRHETIADRKQLVKASKRTSKRYGDDGVEIRAGAGGGTLLLVGGVAAQVGMSAGAAAVYGSTAVAGVTAGALILAPALVTGGVVRSINNRKVNKEIQVRQTEFPALITSEEVMGFDLFFPIAPSPRHIEIRYVDAGAEQILVIDTSVALDGLHLSPDSSANSDML